jgi:hypothetical protein
MVAPERSSVNTYTDETREVTHMARRIAAIVLLSPALDANYLAIKQTVIAWPGLPS